MSEIPYLGLNPFSEKDAPFFFGRDEEKRKIIGKLRVSRLTILFGESGVGKSSILQAGVVPQFRLNAKRNWQDYGTPQLAVVVFKDWHGENPLQELLEKIRASVAEAMGIKLTDLKNEPTPVESLQVWTKILGGEEGRGQLFLILDQFEEYFQSHPRESGEGSFAEEFPRWVNRSDLRVNFIIAMRHDALAKLHHFQGPVPNIFDNQIELKRLGCSAARDAIVKPIGEYNLRQILAHHLQNSRLTVLSAASGMGKSPILQVITDNFRGSITFKSWRGNPMADLIQQVETDLKTLFPDISAPEPGTSLTETLQRWVEHIAEGGGNSQLFIILDQFEEFFQYQPPEMGEGSFVAEFARALTYLELPVHWLISIRDEARDLLKHFQKTIPGIFDHLLQLKQLGENPEIADLVKPIEEPAQQPSQALNIEPQLVKETLNQLSALSLIALMRTVGSGIKPSISQENIEIEAPLLQLVMERLWKEEVDKKRSHCLCLKTLNDLSIPEKNITGTERIVNDYLSEKMKALSDEAQYAMAIVFKFLVTAGGTKIAYPILNLPRDEDTRLDQTELLSVLDQLDAQRILRTVKVPNQPKERHYEIFHDILAWPILNWRDQYLLEKKQKEEEARLDKKRKELILRSSLIGGVILLFGVLTSLGSLVSANVANKIKTLEKGNNEMEEARKAFKSQPSNPSGQIVGLIKAMQAGQTMLIPLKDRWLAWNPFLKASIESDKEKAIKVLKEILENIQEKNYINIFPETSSIRRMSSSPDGQSLAAGLENGTVLLWTLKSGKLQEITVPGGPVNKVPRGPVLSLSFSPPDGQRLAAGFEDGTVLLWTLKSGKPQVQEITVPGGPVLSLSFSPDGQRLATGFESGTVLLWTLKGGKLQETPETKKVFVFKSKVRSLSFSPDGQSLAAGFEDGTVSLWTLKDEKLQEITVPGGPVLSLSFSKDGNLLITGSTAGAFRFWDIRENQEKESLSGNKLDELLKSGCDWLGDYLTTNYGNSKKSNDEKSNGDKDKINGDKENIRCDS
jgi:hypothetical protein